MGKKLIEEVSSQMNLGKLLSFSVNQNNNSNNRLKQSQLINKEITVKNRINETGHAYVEKFDLDQEIQNTNKGFFSKSIGNNKINICLLISHESWFRNVWDFLIFIFTIYTAMITPIYLTFYQDSYLYHLFEQIIELFFIIETIMNFFMTYLDEEENLITDHCMIIEKYIFSWFFYDILYIFPYEFNNLNLCNHMIVFDNKFQIKITLLMWTKIFRIVKILKTQFIVRILNNIFLNQNYALNRILKFTFIFFIVSHISSCFFIYIGFSANSDENWISAANLNHESKLDLYVASLYFNLVTFYSIGYGDITPINTVEKLFIIFFMFTGSMLYSYAISSLSTLFSTNNSKYSSYKSKKKTLDKIFEENKIHPNLYYKIKQIIKQNYTKNDKDRCEFLAQLPSNLRRELSIVMYKSVITRHNFFKNQPYEFALYVLPLLYYRKIEKGEVLLSKGEFIEEVFLVLKGNLSISLGEEFENIKICEIKENQYFGDLLLQLNIQSQYEIKCKSKEAEILVLKKGNFMKIKNLFNNNLMNILESSLKGFKIFEEKNKLYKYLFKYCKRAELVKKKAKQIEKYEFNKNFFKLFWVETKLSEVKIPIYNFNDEEMIDFLIKLDDPMFIHSDVSQDNNIVNVRDIQLDNEVKKIQNNINSRNNSISKFTPFLKNEVKLEQNHQTKERFIPLIRDLLKTHTHSVEKPNIYSPNKKLNKNNLIPTKNKSEESLILNKISNENIFNHVAIINSNEKISNNSNFTKKYSNFLNRLVESFDSFGNFVKDNKELELKERTLRLIDRTNSVMNVNNKASISKAESYKTQYNSIKKSNNKISQNLYQKFYKFNNKKKDLLIKNENFYIEPSNKRTYSFSNLTIVKENNFGFYDKINKNNTNDSLICSKYDNDSFHSLSFLNNPKKIENNYSKIYISKSEIPLFLEKEHTIFCLIDLDSKINKIMYCLYGKRNLY